MQPTPWTTSPTVNSAFYQYRKFIDLLKICIFQIYRNRLPKCLASKSRLRRILQPNSRFLFTPHSRSTPSNSLLSPPPVFLEFVGDRIRLMFDEFPSPTCVCSSRSHSSLSLRFNRTTLSRASSSSINQGQSKKQTKINKHKNSSQKFRKTNQ